MRDYHVYTDIWEATVGEELLREPRNTKDSYAAAMEIYFARLIFAVLLRQ